MLRQLRDFGFGKATMEEALNDEVRKLVDFLRSKDGKIVSLNKTLNVSILNALWNILVGEKLPLNSPKLEHLVTLFDDLFRYIHSKDESSANKAIYSIAFMSKSSLIWMTSYQLSR